MLNGSFPGLFAIFKKEVKEYFAAPIALVVIATFWALCGYFFSFNLFFVNVAQMVTSFHNMTILLILMMPLLTMRIFADENKTGTIELLLTLPLKDWETVLGKYAAAVLILALMLAGTASAVIPLAIFAKPDFGPIIGGYIGVFIFGAMFMAIGVALSAICTNQIVAAILTWGALVLLWFIDYPASLDLFPKFSEILLHMSLSAQHVDLIRGVLDGRSIVYFFSVIVFSLSATIQLLKWRRMK